MAYNLLRVLLVGGRHVVSPSFLASQRLTTQGIVREGTSSTFLASHLTLQLFRTASSMSTSSTLAIETLTKTDLYISRTALAHLSIDGRL